MTIKEINERIEQLKKHIALLADMRDSCSAIETAEGECDALKDAIRQMERRLNEYERAC